MKISKLLNKKILSIIAILLFLGLNIQAEEKPIDIWDINKEGIENTSSDSDLNTEENITEQVSQSNIYKTQQKKINTIQVESDLSSNRVELIGLYDPEDYDLKIDMWSNSNGDQLKYLFSNLAKIDLSKDASNLLNIVLLTNSYFPNKNILVEYENLIMR